MFFSQAGAQPRTGEASPSERKKLVEVFKACDEDNKGYLSREDFKVAVVMLFGYKPSKIEANSVMSSLNPDTSDPYKICLREKPEQSISLEEFLNFVRKKKELQLYRNEIRHIFTAFDRHYRGYLTLEDFQKAFKQVAPKLPERIILEVFSLLWDLNNLNICRVDMADIKRVGVLFSLEANKVQEFFTAEVDQDSDGHVSFKDFEYAMKCGQNEA